MIQNFNHPKCEVGIFGVGGHGKSTLFKKILDAQSADFWFFYDHQGEFCSRFHMEASHDLQTLTEQAGNGRVCFDPARMFPGRSGDGFLFFCDFIYQFSGEFKGRKILVCDEMHKLCFQDDPLELVTVMDLGRRRELDVFCVAQSPNQLHNMVQNQFTEIYTFRQANANATKHLIDVGFDKKELLTLKPGEYLWRNLTTGEARRGGKAFRIKPTAKHGF
jgi:hypothetical protein